MNYISLDFSGIDSAEKLHEYLKTVLELPDYYGRNLDALWDLLYKFFKEPTVIMLKNTECLPDEMNRIKRGLFSLFFDLEARDENVTVILSSAPPVPHRDN